MNWGVVTLIFDLGIRRQSPMPPARFEPAIPPSERLQTHFLDRAATGIVSLQLFFCMARQPYMGLGRLIFRGFTITLFRHTTLGRTPLDEWPVRRRDLYLTTHNTHKRQTSMPSVGFEPAIPPSERLQIHFLDRAATGIGSLLLLTKP
jgi:hypothetical protein